jgi:N-acetylneuraminic acid mutarotase
MNEGRSEAVAVQLNNGKVLIAGSIQSGGALASTELYDPVSNSFAALAQTATMNESRDNAVAATLSSGKVLIAGGVQFPPFLTDLYDPASNSFAPPAQTAAMSERFGAVAVALNNGKVLIAGGDTLFAVNVLATTDLYDEATNTFAPPSATATMNTPRVAFAGVLLTAGPNAGKALMIGGQGFFGGRSTMALSSTDLYDPMTNSFAPSNETPTMNIARIGVTATVLNNGKVLVAGGAQQVELYDPMTNTFTLGPMMNSVPPSNEGYGGYITATLIK